MHIFSRNLRVVGHPTKGMDATVVLDLSLALDVVNLCRQRDAVLKVNTADRNIQRYTDILDLNHSILGNY